MRDIMMDTVIVLFTNKVSSLALSVSSVTDLTARIVKVGHCNLVPRLNGQLGGGLAAAWPLVQTWMGCDGGGRGAQLSGEHRILDRLLARARRPDYIQWATQAIPYPGEGDSVFSHKAEKRERSPQPRAATLLMLSWLWWLFVLCVSYCVALFCVCLFLYSGAPHIPPGRSWIRGWSLVCMCFGISLSAGQFVPGFAASLRQAPRPQQQQQQKQRQQTRKIQAPGPTIDQTRRKTTNTHTHATNTPDKNRQFSQFLTFLGQRLLKKYSGSNFSFD